AILILVSLILVIAFEGLYSRAPIPRVPTYASCSIGETLCLFVVIIHSLNTKFPKTSGNESANTGGKLLNVSPLKCVNPWISSVFFNRKGNRGLKFSVAKKMGLY